MDESFLLLLVLLSSLVTYLVGAKRLGLSTQNLGRAGARMLETVGLIVIFAVVNTAIGVAAILATPTLRHSFLSLYIANHPTLWVLSLFQGLAFQGWRATRGRDVPCAAPGQRSPPAALPPFTRSRAPP